MTIAKHNSLQFLFLDRARFEDFDGKDGVLVRNIPFELRPKLFRWTWLDSSKDHYFFHDTAGQDVITREGWEAFVRWVCAALDEKLSNDCNIHKSDYVAPEPITQGESKRPTLQQLIWEREEEEDD